jgi:hypothetical protein
MVVGRFVASLFLLLVSFAVGFFVAGLAALLLTDNPVRAAVIGVICGFAAAFVLNIIIIRGRQTRGRDG